MFNTFIEQLQAKLQEELPGEPAQFKMAPFERPLKEEAMKHNPNPKPSAVLILLYPHQGQVNTVLMLRNDYPGVHSNQVGFPGGKVEKEDQSLKDTALREAEEEIGINRKEVSVIGNLSEVYIHPSNYLVTPYLGYTSKQPIFTPDHSEVQEIIETPLSLIQDDRLVKETTIHIQARNIKIKAPYFDIQGHKVWGATAMILSEFKEILKTI